MQLQLTEEIAEQAKGNDDFLVIITKGQKSNLKRLSHIKRRREKDKGLFGKILTKDFWRERESY